MSCPAQTTITLFPFFLGAGDLSEQLAPRVLSVIFEVWLLACHYSFPRPPLWRTFHDMCRNWRHHRVLVDQWHRVNLALTDRVLRNMYGLEFPQSKTRKEA